jgi:hypothetical protein
MVPQVLAEQFWFSLETLFIAVRTELHNAFSNGPRIKRDTSIPTRKHLERSTGMKIHTRLFIVPEEIPCGIPVAIFGYVEERVASHTTRNPNIKNVDRTEG